MESMSITMCIIQKEWAITHQHLHFGMLCLKLKLKEIKIIMNKIDINYNKKLVTDKKIFESYMTSLQKLYPNQVTFNLSKVSAFDLYFNEKLIYSLEDSFNEDLSIDKDILDKSKKYIENSIDLSNSRDIPRVDDIGIVDY
tara:strand:- start:179 stop:601 length:423 start_codon:yes stop_codon:yes gene_type:complete